MKILYLNNVMTVGGVSKCILKLCKELKLNYEIVVASHGGALLNEFSNLGLKHYEILDVENKNPVNIIANVNRIIKIIKSENIDIVHSHHRMTTLLAKIASKFTGVKVIHTQHLCIEDKFKLTKVALNNIETIAVSEAAKNILQTKSNLDGNKITTIYNTIETENHNNIVDERLIQLKQKGYFIVAQVSRLIDYKGVYDFVDVAKETIKQNKSIRFVFIGDGPETDNLKKYIKQNSIEDYVIMLGSKNNVIKHLKYIDLVLLCSYIEGLPLAPLESFSQQVPVIATNIGGTNEEIIDSYNGYLVDKKDITYFAKKIEFLYKNKDVYEEMKKNCIEIYNDKFSTSKYINSHIYVYNQVINY